jgi:RHS repeat-associated protein
MNPRLALVALTLLTAASFTASAQSTLTPLADAHVQDGKSGAKNFGTASTLEVATSAKAGSNFDSYLKFDMKAVPAFAQVKLRLFAGLSAKGSVTTTVYAVPLTSWAEKTITWNNKPARGAVLTTFTVASKNSALVEIDLTRYLLSERAQGRNVVSLALHSVANTAATLKANSREAKTNKPLLVFTADKAPTVSLTTPATGAVFPALSAINVAASVADVDGSVSKVEFFQGATLIGTATSAPYSINWSNVAAGRYSLTAKATDNSGVATTSAAVAIVVDVLPSVSLTAPVDQSSYRAPAAFSLSADASDSDGSIARVEFYQGGTLLKTVTTAPYSVPISQSTPGTYTYSAKAFDNNGLSTQSSSIVVTVLADVAPTVTLTAPSDGARFRTPAAITLTATANDPDGTIARVDFYQAGTLVGSAPAGGPYSVTVNQATAGNFTFYAKAVDDAGLETQSNSVTVTVASAPAMYYIYADQIDTPRVVTDQTNKVVWRWDSADPFGASVPGEDPDGDGVRFTLNLRFPGQYFDKETGLHYNYFRDYDPSTGRYIESDPIGLAAGPNTYGYVDGDPISKSDPEGLFVDEGGAYLAIPAVVAATAAVVTAPAWVLPVAVGVGVVATGTAIYLACKPDNEKPDSEDKCKALKEKIENLRKNIRRREQDLTDNRLGLPERAPGRPLRDSKYGHRVLIDKDWQRLTELEKQYIRECLSK